MVFLVYHGDVRELLSFANLVSPFGKSYRLGHISVHLSLSLATNNFGWSIPSFCQFWGVPMSDEFLLLSLELLDPPGRKPFPSRSLIHLLPSIYLSFLLSFPLLCLLIAFYLFSLLFLISCSMLCHHHIFIQRDLLLIELLLGCHFLLFLLNHVTSQLIGECITKQSGWHKTFKEQHGLTLSVMTQYKAL